MRASPLPTRPSSSSHMKMRSKCFPVPQAWSSSSRVLSHNLPHTSFTLARALTQNRHKEQQTRRAHTQFIDPPTRTHTPPISAIRFSRDFSIGIRITALFFPGQPHPFIHSLPEAGPADRMGFLAATAQLSKASTSQSKPTPPPQNKPNRPVQRHTLQGFGPTTGHKLSGEKKRDKPQSRGPDQQGQ